MLWGKDLAISSVILPTDDRCVDFPAIEGVQKVARVIEPHFDGERRVMGMEPREQCGNFRPADMGGNAERETATNGRQPRYGVIVRGEEVACGFEEYRTLGRQAHPARCPFDQLSAEPVFQPLQLHTDRALRGGKRFGRARETLEIGDGYECFDGINIQCGHVSYPKLLSLKYSSIQF